MSCLQSSSHVSSLQRTAANAPLLTAETERQLSQRAKAGDQRALDELVRSHLRLVLAMSNEFSRRHGLPLDELISEGLLGLMIAARRYESAHGTRLAAYAAIWIRSRLRKYSLANRRMVGAPSSRRGRLLLGSLSRTEHALARSHSDSVPADVVARELGVDAADISEARAALHGRDVAYDETTLHHAASTSRSPEVLVAHAEEQGQRQAVLAELFARLEPREQKVLRARRLSDEPLTLARLGHQLGLSGEGVRLIEKQGFNKLRHMASEACAASI